LLCLSTCCVHVSLASDDTELTGGCSADGYDFPSERSFPQCLLPLTSRVVAPREVRRLWWLWSCLQPDATSGSQVLAGGASTKVVFTLPLTSPHSSYYFPFSRTLSHSSTPPLRRLLAGGNSANSIYNFLNTFPLFFFRPVWFIL
jgi:hypothetical protein